MFKIFRKKTLTEEQKRELGLSLTKDMIDLDGIRILKEKYIKDHSAVKNNKEGA